MQLKQIVILQDCRLQNISKKVKTTVNKLQAMKNKAKKQIERNAFLQDKIKEGNIKCQRANNGQILIKFFSI